MNEAIAGKHASTFPIARYIYIGVKLLGFTEREVWKMTLYKLISMFEIHKEFNPDRFKKNPHARDGDIDSILGGF